LGATQLNMATVTMQAAPTRTDLGRHGALRTVERQLAHYVGPMAKVMIRQAASRAHDISELYGLLSENISDPVGRRRFYEGRPHLRTGPRLTSPRERAIPAPRRGQCPQPLEKIVRRPDHDATGRLPSGPIARVVPRAGRRQKAASQEEFVQLVAGHLGAQERGGVPARDRLRRLRSGARASNRALALIPWRAAGGRQACAGACMARVAPASTQRRSMIAAMP